MAHFVRFILLFCLIQALSAESIEVKEFSNPEQEARYRTLIDEIRCPVCQGQSIGGSNASLAKDLRERVREMIIKDKNNEQIAKFMTDRYGDFVIFKPPVNKNTYLLWFAPFAFLILGLLFFIKKLTSKKQPTITQKLDTTKAKELLNE